VEFDLRSPPKKGLDVEVKFVVAAWAIEAPRAYASEAKGADATARRLREQKRKAIAP